MAALIISLFLNTVELNHNLCAYDINLVAKIPHIAYPVSQQTYILSTPTADSQLKCYKVPTVKTPSFSVVHVLCRCELTNGNLTLMNTNISCLDYKLDKVNFKYTVNLPLVYHMKIPNKVINEPYIIHLPERKSFLELEALRRQHLKEGLATAEGYRDLGLIAKKIFDNTPYTLNFQKVKDRVIMGINSPIFDIVVAIYNTRDVSRELPS